MAPTKQSRVDTDELARLERIKRLVVIAMFSEDEWMERFVLKGGNALDLILRLGARASIDIDLSMESDFRPGELELIRAKAEKNLVATFGPEGYVVFDVTLEERPENLSPELASFWGGYRISFKLIAAARHAEFAHDLTALRRNAVMIGGKGKFEVDISRFEYCAPKRADDLEGFRIYVYSPEMIVAEKLRAICQQMPEYGPVVKRNRPGTARARDFLDIYTVIEACGLDMTTPENRALLSHVFEAKKVPLALLDAISKYSDFHRPDFYAVKDTLKAGVEAKEFDVYFDYVVNLCRRLKTLRDV